MRRTGESPFEVPMLTHTHTHTHTFMFIHMMTVSVNLRLMGELLQPLGCLKCIFMEAKHLGSA